MEFKQTLRGRVLEFGKGESGVDLVDLEIVLFARGEFAPRHDASGFAEIGGYARDFRDGKMAGVFEVQFELGWLGFEILNGNPAGAGIIFQGGVEIVGLIEAAGEVIEVGEVGVPVCWFFGGI